MFKGEPITPAHMGQNNIRMPPTGRPKGMGRKKPHSGVHTRKGSETTGNAIAIANGLSKISVFFTGKPLNKPAKPRVSKNPFTKLVNLFLKGNK